MQEVGGKPLVSSLLSDCSAAPEHKADRENVLEYVIAAPEHKTDGELKLAACDKPLKKSLPFIGLRQRSTGRTVSSRKQRVKSHLGIHFLHRFSRRQSTRRTVRSCSRLSMRHHITRRFVRSCMGMSQRHQSTRRMARPCKQQVISRLKFTSFIATCGTKAQGEP